MAVNILYAAIIPKKQLFTPGTDVLAVFFKLTIGHKITNANHLKTFYSIIKAISAFGNLIVVAFTIARGANTLHDLEAYANMKAVKQEIAKEGIYPYSIVFAESQNLSLSRIFGHKSKSKAGVHHEKTPVATLVLHWVITNILIVAPVVAIQPKPYSSSAAYSYLTSAFIYDINVTYFIIIAIGLLCLRLTPSVRWAEKSPQRPWISVTAALILLIGCLFPFIFIWVPDPKFPKASNGLVSW